MHLPGHTLTYQIPPGHSHTLNTHIEIILFMTSHHFLFWWPRPTTSPSSNFLWTHLYLITTHSGSTCHVLNLTDPQSHPQLSTLLPQWSLPFHHIWYSSLEFQHCSWALSSSNVMPSFLRLNLMIHYHLNYALNSILDSLALWPPAPALTQLHTSDCPWESQTPCIQMKFLPDLLFFSFSISLLQWGALNPPKDSNQKSESHSWSPSVPQSWHSTSLYYLLKLVLSLYTARGALTEAFIFSTNDKKKKTPTCSPGFNLNPSAILCQWWKYLASPLFTLPSPNTKLARILQNICDSLFCNFLRKELEKTYRDIYNKKRRYGKKKEERLNQR